MDLTLFCALFIFQFIGHRMGDYLFQTHTQAVNKVHDKIARLKHCLVYSTIVSAMTLFLVDVRLALLVFIITLIEHMWIDSRKPVVAFKEFFENKIAKTKDFKADTLPLYVMVGMDQTFHYLRIFLISLLIANL